jgi:hypothetical protein
MLGCGAAAGPRAAHYTIYGIWLYVGLSSVPIYMGIWAAITWVLSLSCLALSRQFDRMVDKLVTSCIRLSSDGHMVGVLGVSPHIPASLIFLACLPLQLYDWHISYTRTRLGSHCAAILMAADLQITHNHWPMPHWQLASTCHLRIITAPCRMCCSQLLTSWA